MIPVPGFDARFGETIWFYLLSLDLLISGKLLPEKDKGGTYKALLLSIICY